MTVQVARGVGSTDGHIIGALAFNSNSVPKWPMPVVAKFVLHCIFILTSVASVLHCAKNSPGLTNYLRRQRPSGCSAPVIEL